MSECSIEWDPSVRIPRRTYCEHYSRVGYDINQCYTLHLELALVGPRGCGSTPPAPASIGRGARGRSGRGGRGGRGGQGGRGRGPASGQGQGDRATESSMATQIEALQ